MTTPEDRRIKVKYLDAVAIVKLVVDEGDCQPLRKFYYSHAAFCATSLCLAEALNVLKRKWIREKKITIDEYFLATSTLIIDCWGKKIELDDLGLVNPSVHDQVEKIARKHGLDLSDALQLMTILTGKYSFFGGNSRSVLITADINLAFAAKAEGIRFWNCIAEPKPAWL